MPVFLAGLNLYDVSGSDLLDRATPSLHAAGSGRDDQDLPGRMSVPRGTGTWFERDGPATRV